VVILSGKVWRHGRVPRKTSIRTADMSGLRFEPGTYGAAYWTATLRENPMFRHMSGLVMCALEGRAGMVEMYVSL